jgi:hypothetical protein
MPTHEHTLAMAIVKSNLAHSNLRAPVHLRGCAWIATMIRPRKLVPATRLVHDAALHV